MNPLLEAEEEHWSQGKQVQPFTEEDKADAITTFYLMAKILATKENNMAQDFYIIASKLKALQDESALNLLSSYLQPETIYSIDKVKSFVFLKKISEALSDDTKVLEKKLSKRVVLDMIHIIFYKTLPCPNGNHCKHYPRKIVHKNDFLDVELDCYFYHHEKDRRRFVLNDGDKEFRYAGNFACGKNANSKSGFSLNFFESLYHPLYYKNFRCVRTKCDKSILCPYNHSLEEKTVWTTAFRDFFGKDREIFTKKRNSEEEKNIKNFQKRFSGMEGRVGFVKRLSFIGGNTMK